MFCGLDDIYCVFMGTLDNLSALMRQYGLTGRSTNEALLVIEHPMNRLKALPRVDSEGVMCGANFKVDAFTKINSMPRVGSATNWAATWDEA
uniref:DUF3700 domain-containing protein n=1 Tax=Aegilops tauschii subsp. strangulata TaxID=200361 RepID=A0A453DH65_AEGTS